MSTTKDTLLSKFKIHPVESAGLFYNKFEYSIRFGLSELGVIRGLNFDIIDEIVKERNQWRQEHRSLYSGYKNIITTDEVECLKKVCELLLQHRDSIKFVISYHTGYVYTNDLTLAQKLDDLEVVDSIRVQQAVQTRPQGTIALKDPQWTHRTYFRSITVSESAKATLVEYLNGRENVRLSPGLIYWTKHTNSWNNWIQSYYFIDHNNDGEVLFLNMVVPRITGRTLQIIAK